MNEAVCSHFIIIPKLTKSLLTVLSNQSSCEEKNQDVSLKFIIVVQRNSVFFSMVNVRATTSSICEYFSGSVEHSKDLWTA